MQESNVKCSICGNIEHNTIYQVKERIINCGDEFEYLKCSQCHTLMLNENIQDMSVWYPQDYNPYIHTELSRDNRMVHFLKILRKKILFRIVTRLKSEKVYYSFIPNLPLNKLLKRFYGSDITKTSSILDVGCASGYLLDDLRELGYKNLTGLDLFVPPHRLEGKDWVFIQGDVFTLSNAKKYDCIVLNHSFEHMFEPLKTLCCIRELLHSEGICIISIPLIDGPAWELYQTDYSQIDAPRHAYIYSRDSFEYLCGKAGLKIKCCLYDENAGIFTYSEALQNSNKSHGEIAKDIAANSKLVTDSHKKLARESCAQRHGDEAIFYLERE